MPNPFSTEPAASAGVAMALIYILAAFGLPIDENQQQVLRDNLPIVLPGIGVLVIWIRQLVMPTARAEEQATEAYSAGVASVIVPAVDLDYVG